MQQFYAEFQVQDLHQIVNELDAKVLDHTHSRGTKSIESIAANPCMNMWKAVECSKQTS